MTKRFVIGAVVCLGLGVVGAKLLVRYTSSDRYFSARGQFTEQEYRAAALKYYGQPSSPEDVTLPLDPKRPVRLAIGSLGFAEDARNRELADLVTAELTGAEGLELVDRPSLDRVLQELQLSVSGLVRAGDAVRVGGLLRADWFLFGSTVVAGGTTSMVARVVDARSGVLRDVGVVRAEPEAPATAGKLAEFVRECRRGGTRVGPHVYVAIGAFEDLSLNNRVADLPTQLRAGLALAYRDRRITLLERECISALLREVHLDLAGLTGEGAAGGMRRMQSAFWLLRGCYQSYEASGVEVELRLEVQRIFGRSKTVTLRGPPGERLIQQVTAELDSVLAGADDSVMVPTRLSEIRAQMLTGRELTQLHGWVDLLTPRYRSFEPQQALRERRNQQEAIRAFETVLLLDPGNREAKMFLAACWRNPTIAREGEARELYRELIEEEVDDEWAGRAKRALELSFDWYANEERKAWFRTAASQTPRPELAAYYLQMTDDRKADEIVRTGSVRDPREFEKAEQRLFESIHAFRAVRSGDPSMGLGDFVEAYGTNRTAAAHRLTELYPRMKEEAPELAAHLLATVVTFQVETNVPIVAEFQVLLDRFIEHPEEVPGQSGFWGWLGNEIVDWALEHRCYRMAAQALSAKPPGTDGYDDRRWLMLAYGYEAAERWQEALRIFERYHGLPVRMDASGPWGDHRSAALTGVEANRCRKRLGQPEVHDPREFQLPPPCHTFCCAAVTIATDRQGLWAGQHNTLVKLGFDLRTNWVAPLPKPYETPITALCLGPSNVWIGTAGDGLIEFDVASHRSRRLTVQDGLEMNGIAALALDGETLWIGYGYTDYPRSSEGGGLGCLHLASRELTFFTRSLAQGPEPHRRSLGYTRRESTDAPTRQPVRVVATPGPGDIWFLASNNPLRRYLVPSRTWQAFEQVEISGGLAADADQLIAGGHLVPEARNGTAAPSLGVSVHTLKTGAWRDVAATGGLPLDGVSTLALEGSSLWVGGLGFIACVDLKRDEVRALAYVPGWPVQGFHVGGGNVWVPHEDHLHRIAPTEVP